MSEPVVKLYPLIGEYFDSVANKIRRVKWDQEKLHLNGRQIAVISTRPGAPIGLLGGVTVTPKERDAIARVVAAARGGVPPAKIGEQVKLPYELLDDDDDELDEVEVGEETEVDGE